jgi:hypothetical protein
VSPLRPGMNRRYGGSEYPATVLADAPLIYWPLDELSGAVAQDRTANDRDGTYNGCSLGVPGLLSGATAVFFDGIDDYVRSASYILNQATATVEAWIRITAAPAGLSLIAGCGTGSTEDKLLHLRGDGKLYFYAFDGGTQLTSAPSVTVPLNEWVHCVGVADGTNLYAYQNGVQVGTVACGNTFTGYGSANVLVGGETSGGNFGDLTGTADEVAFYAGGLSSARVMAHYQAGV